MKTRYVLMILSIFAAVAAAALIMLVTIKINSSKIETYKAEETRIIDDEMELYEELMTEVEEYENIEELSLNEEECGDYGWEDEPDITNVIATERRKGESYAMLLCRMAFKYDNGMIYKENGYEWGGLIEPVSRCPSTLIGVYGIGNEAYVQMLYMYTFSFVPKELYDLSSIDKYCEEISEQELMTGDIAVCVYDYDVKDYAVCIGQRNGHFLFSHCVNTGNDRFPGGCSKICYNKNEYNSYYRGNEPTAFTKFYRSPISDWE